MKYIFSQSSKKQERKIAVLTDSCADVPPELAARHRIYVLPLQIRCSEGVFRDGVDIQSDDIYRIQQKEMPGSSLPLGGDLMALLERIAKDGYTHVIALMMSSGLSGTYNLVRQSEETAEELGLTMKAYDTLTSSLGTGAIALQLSEYLETETLTFEQACRRTETLIRGTTVFFSVDTLKFLQKGGRIGKITAVAGSVLQIRPILAFAPDGQLTSVAKVRGRKLIQDTLIKLVAEKYTPGRRFNLMVADGGAPDEVKELAKKLTKAFPGYHNLYRSRIGATLSIYTGGGVLGAAIQYLD